jgi:uncharacterized protein YdcH (DUF465 family)
MEKNPLEELKAHLMQTDEAFRQLVTQHSEYAHQLDDLAERPHLTEPEKVEEVRLKKLKLFAKDQIEAIVSRYRAQHVA